MPGAHSAYPLEKDVTESWQRKVLCNGLGKLSVLFSVSVQGLGPWTLQKTPLHDFLCEPYQT